MPRTAAPRETAHTLLGFYVCMNVMNPDRHAMLDPKVVEDMTIIIIIQTGCSGEARGKESGEKRATADVSMEPR